MLVINMLMAVVNSLTVALPVFEYSACIVWGGGME